MDELKFVDRKREIDMLQRFYQDPKAGLMILYGRRRVGKTRLLIHFLRQEDTGADSFYWSATTHSAAYQLQSFSKELFARVTATPIERLAPDFAFADWEAALQYMGDELAAKATKPRLIVLDEFTYLVRSDPPVPSIFQKMWDHHLSKIPNLKLILTGSLVGMMEREVLSYKAPLYGRAKAQFKLRPLPYAALLELFPDRQPSERVAIYSVCGGIPAYLELFTRTKSFSTALRDHCLVPGSIMLTDPALLLYEQLREPQKYESVLWAIASGHQQWKDIARLSGIPEGSIGHYINVLTDLEVIQRHDPVLTQRRGRQGRYTVKDDFLRFYYRFIAPKMSAIDQGQMEVVSQRINQELRSFIGANTFERLCQDWVWAAAATGELDWLPEEVRSYWKQEKGGGVQLDVVAANRADKKLLIGEAKWRNRKVSRQVLLDLVERSRRMPQVAQGWEVEYVLFSRYSFTSAAEKAAQEIKARLITLRDLEETLARAHG